MFEVKKNEKQAAAELADRTAFVILGRSLIKPIATSPVNRLFIILFIELKTLPRTVRFCLRPPILTWH